MSPARILVVDDDPRILQLIADLLSPLYTVSKQTNAIDAILQLDWELVDLLIIDLNMPTLSGEEAIRMIRGRPAGHDLPILVISAYYELNRRLAGSDVQAILDKPFKNAELLDTVERLLAESRRTVNDDGGPSEPMAE